MRIGYGAPRKKELKSKSTPSPQLPLKRQTHLINIHRPRAFSLSLALLAIALLSEDEASKDAALLLVSRKLGLADESASEASAEGADLVLNVFLELAVVSLSTVVEGAAAEDLGRLLLVWALTTSVAALSAFLLLLFPGL